MRPMLRWGPELALGLVAIAAMLGFLGSTELWGKREQRAAAEALDTVDRGHWLVAEIQGRPRLEKPPLPRWITAGLLVATGRRDEAIVRLPNAIAALATVALVYALGCSIGGRSVGLASGLALASTAYFLVEMRQAGNDGMLTLFVTVALFAAWRRLHGAGGSAGAPGDSPGARGWSVLFFLALGLGFLTKGPVILLLAGVPIVADLASRGRLKAGLLRLSDGRGLVLFVLLALAWPVPVLVRDPSAARVWYLEMAQKTGALDMPHDQVRGALAVDWLWMTLPWTPLALLGLAWPMRRASRQRQPGLGLAWWWAVGNLLILSAWKVAKPNYYLPCLPAVALLVGSEWIRLASLAREATRSALGARLMLQGFWVALFVGGMVAPVVAARVEPEAIVAVGAGALALVVGVVGSAWAWRRGGDAVAFGGLAAGLVAVALVGYGAVAPRQNAARGHRELARALERVLPAEIRTVRFFPEVDEGLWFYLRGHVLAPMASGKTRYNRGLDLRDDVQARQVDTPARRLAQARDQLADWARHADPAEPFLLIRGKIHDRLAPDLATLVEEVYRERDLERNEIVLLRAIAKPDTVAVAPADRR